MAGKEPRMTKADLRKVYDAWKREEIEQIELTEATAAYLEGRPMPVNSSRHISQVQA